MQSLRNTRRPSQGSGAPKLTKPAPSSKNKSRVNDKIKKRMSTRYATISAPTEASIPPLPSLSIGQRPSAQDEEVVMEPEEVREDPRLAELRALDNEAFDPDAYLKVKLANSTEAEIKSLQSSLRSSRDATTAELQRNVFKNYAEFMTISKELNSLENAMLELKDSLAEWKSMPSLLHIDDSASLADRRRTQRSSIADLKLLYASQLQAMHAQIEGSSKFIPATAGRHIVTELEGISRLNAATYKVEYAVKFVLLDDSVLVARRRNRRRDRAQLVAERCWQYTDISVLDTKDTPTITNVFKVRHGKELHVFRTEIASDKKFLLTQFRQVSEDLATRKRKEREGEHERRKSMWVGNTADRRSFALDMDSMPPISDFLAEMVAQGEGGAKEKAENDSLAVNELTDKLTVAIALRQWDDAVVLVEQGQDKLASMPLLAPKLTTLTSSLTASLLHALSDPTKKKSQVIALTALLSRLGADAAAKSAFLRMRSDVAKKRVRMIRFEGHTQRYISDLAIVVFTGVKHTADWYLQSFKNNDATSCFVDWAKQQVENYAEMFRKQVFSADTDNQTVRDCIDITQTQAKKLLQEYGLDFNFLFHALLVPPDKLPAPPSSKHPKVSISLSAFDNGQGSLPPSLSADPSPSSLSTSLPLSSTAPGLSPPTTPDQPSTRIPRPRPGMRSNPALPVRSRDRPPSFSNPRGVPQVAPAPAGRRDGMI